MLRVCAVLHCQQTTLYMPYRQFRSHERCHKKSQRRTHSWRLNAFMNSCPAARPRTMVACRLAHPVPCAVLAAPGWGNPARPRSFCLAMAGAAAAAAALATVARQGIALHATGAIPAAPPRLLSHPYTHLPHGRTIICTCSPLHTRLLAVLAAPSPQSVMMCISHMTAHPSPCIFHSKVQGTP